MWRRKIKVLSSYIGVFTWAKSRDMLHKHVNERWHCPRFRRDWEKQLKYNLDIVFCLPPFFLICDFGKQNTRGNVSKISVSLACYWQMGSKSTNYSQKCDLLTFSTSCYRAVIGGFRSDLSDIFLHRSLYWRKHELKGILLNLFYKVVERYTNNSQCFCLGDLILNNTG